jgi:hypothetical protein
MKRVKSFIWWICHPLYWIYYVRVQTALYGPLAIFGKRAKPADMKAYRALLNKGN